MVERFSATVARWARESEQRMEAVFKLAVEKTIEEIIDRTPADTGFMRAGFMASTSGFALALKENPYPGGRKKKNLPPLFGPPEEYVLAINSAELGDTIYANFTANYAAYVENGARGRPPVGMVKLAAQNWQKNVDSAVSQLRAR